MEDEFDLMKETAFLINTARGAIVDEPALIRALEAKKSPEPAWTQWSRSPSRGWRGLWTRYIALCV